MLRSRKEELKYRLMVAAAFIWIICLAAFASHLVTRPLQSPGPGFWTRVAAIFR